MRQLPRALRNLPLPAIASPMFIVSTPRLVTSRLISVL